MKREELKALGLTDEQVDKVMASHGQTVQSLNTNLATLQQSETDLKAQLASRDKDLSKLQKDNKDNEELSAQLKTLQANYKTLQDTSAANLVKLQRDSAISAFLSDSKVKNTKAVKALLDDEKIVYKDGELTGVKEQIESLQKTEAYLFDLGTRKAGYNPAAGSATDNYKTFDEAMEKDDIDGYLQQLIESEEIE